MRASFYVKYNKKRCRKWFYYLSSGVRRYKFRPTWSRIITPKRLAARNSYLSNRAKAVIDFIKSYVNIQKTKAAQLVKKLHQNKKRILLSKRKRLIKVASLFLTNKQKLQYSRFLKYGYKRIQSPATIKTSFNSTTTKIRSKLNTAVFLTREQELELWFLQTCEENKEVIEEVHDSLLEEIVEEEEEIAYEEFLWRAEHADPLISFKWGDESYYAPAPPFDPDEEDIYEAYCELKAEIEAENAELDPEQRIILKDYDYYYNAIKKDDIVESWGENAAGGLFTVNNDPSDDETGKKSDTDGYIDENNNTVPNVLEKTSKVNNTPYWEEYNGHVPCEPNEAEKNVDDEEDTDEYEKNYVEQCLIFEKFQTQVVPSSTDASLYGFLSNQNFFIWFWDLYHHDDYYYNLEYWFSLLWFNPWVEYEKFDDFDFCVLYWHVDWMDAEEVETEMTPPWLHRPDWPVHEMSVYPNLRALAPFFQNVTALTADFENGDDWCADIPVLLENEKTVAPASSAEWLFTRKRHENVLVFFPAFEPAIIEKKRAVRKVSDDGTKKVDGWSPARRAAHDRKKKLRLQAAPGVLENSDYNKNEDNKDSDDENNDENDNDYYAKYNRKDTPSRALSGDNQEIDLKQEVKANSCNNLNAPFLLVKKVDGWSPARRAAHLRSKTNKTKALK
jgi:hypothetical protein